MIEQAKPPKKLLISQRDNFAQKFGLVLRSSAIFYYAYSDELSTTISFMNYWKLKRDIDVAIVASLRNMDGTLIYRRELSFDQGEVINYSPRVDGRDNFEGSLEIEIFSTKNMAIPYAAIMSVYESKRGFSMVHSYSRTYSPYEIEEGLTISIGEEACWTLRDSSDSRSFCVFHNGGTEQNEQTITLRVLGPNNESREAVIDLPALRPYQTVKLYPSSYITDLAEWLNGDIGNASISFNVSGAFTRLLIGNESFDGSDLQVTHSNFNYSKHQTDSLEEHANAYMNIPHCGIENKQVIVYPDSDPGQYELTYKDTSISFQTGERVNLAVKDGTISFRKKNGMLPTRIVTGLVCENELGHLPSECSLGVVTHLRPAKRLWWSLCSADTNHKCKLIIIDSPETYSLTEPLRLSIRLYSSSRQHYLETLLENPSLEEFSKGISIDTLFPNAQEFLNEEFGYVTVYSDYGGLICYTLIQNQYGSHCIEHGF